MNPPPSNLETQRISAGTTTAQTGAGYVAKSPFVTGLGRFIEDAVDASLLQRFDIRLACSPVLPASVADKY